MTTDRIARSSAPQPLCAVYEPLLPLLALGELDEDQAAATSEHVAGCAECEQQLEECSLVCAAISRTYALDRDRDISPLLTFDDVVRADDELGEEEDERPARQLLAHPRLRALRTRRVRDISGLGVLAAALLLTLVVNWIFQIRTSGITTRALAGGGTLTEYQLPGAASRPVHITAGPDGNLWFTLTGAIGRITTHGVITLFPLPARSDANPNDITAGPDGNLWFTLAGAIGRITTHGVITLFPLQDTPGSNPTDIIAGPDGNLWFTVEFHDSSQGSSWTSLGRVTPRGAITIVTQIGGGYGGEATGIIAAGTDRAVWFITGDNYTIGRLTASGVITTIAVPNDAATPTYIFEATNGALWFSNSVGTIGRINPDHSNSITVFSEPARWGDNYPSAVTPGRNGDLWAISGGLLSHIGPNGVVTTMPLPSGLDPSGIVLGPDGNLWITERLGNKIGRIHLGR